MIRKHSRPGGSRLAVLLMASFLTLWYGCNPQRQSTAETATPKQIVAIQVMEAADSWNCIISGNRQLTFSAVNSVSPPGLLLYFPDTRLGIPQNTLPPRANEIIGSIATAEFIEGNAANARVLIELKVARPYRISPAASAIVIAFPKVLAEPVDPQSADEPLTRESVPADQPGPRMASQLMQVTAVPMKDYIIVNLEADGTILDYRSFSIDDPARIVFDLNNLQNRIAPARTIPVDSPWVKRIRYNSYPDKIRLVLDTHQRFLKQHFSLSTEDGLLIYVGQLPQPIQN